jgi:hypothetical protein
MTMLFFWVVAPCTVCIFRAEALRDYTASQLGTKTSSGLNYFSQGTEWLKSNADSNVTKFQFLKDISAELPKTTAVSIAVNGFRSCGTFQGYLDEIPDHVFAPSKAFGAKWKLPSGVAKILPCATEDHVRPVKMQAYIV